MYRIICQLMTPLSLVLLGCSNSQATELTLNNTPAQVYFSPNGGATDAVVKEAGRQSPRYWFRRILLRARTLQRLLWMLIKGEFMLR